jgi:hypothetical protein
MRTIQALMWLWFSDTLIINFELIFWNKQEVWNLKVRVFNPENFDESHYNHVKHYYPNRHLSNSYSQINNT